MIEEKVRLHITPFSKDLAQSIVSAQSSVAAESISYHTLDTFPEHSYGYIELPTMEAEKLKKKLNGSILKGKKLRIEHARPQKRRFEREQGEEGRISPVGEECRLSKKPRKSVSELQGHELAPERKVKRGWTEPEKGNRMGTSKSRSASRVTSKYTDKPECMFRVQLSQHKKIETTGLSTTRTDKDMKKGKKATVIHEFEKSVIQPSFIRSNVATGNAGVAAEYIKGKGWVDTNGNILEESTRQLRSRSRTDQSQRMYEASETKVVREIQAPLSIEQGSQSEIDRSCGQPKQTSTTTRKDQVSSGHKNAVKEVLDEETSSSGTSSSDSESSFASDEGLAQEAEQELASKLDEAEAEHPRMSKDASEATPTPSAAVHPLEALFKRPDQAASQARGRRPLEIKTSFNFFEPDDEQTVPQTPFTTRDLQLRGLRSAAPTPDTALPTRRFFSESMSPSSEAGNDDRANTEGRSGEKVESDDSRVNEGESGFAKWFWEHRGENNRAWKRRRREALKEKRQKENRQRGRRSG
ncbi:hypothetical protein EPUS_03632 [Endocarpon pusillum Z07020]|uniref:RRM domain-containing protein n=1 Tax=Endocarpon pusillum (strain Z07020 / HMAS-L-300199) TaxID=1263415 RepID=U1HHM4_ENDPU|nr:uncharacterized protein EPUS_03632 [Endocarpon pusillum Z07020]ERF69640.1 hypothetical protein EPUS_03632 [Endocarpon pusillum Z07020]